MNDLHLHLPQVAQLTITSAKKTKKQAHLKQLDELDPEFRDMIEQVNYFNSKKSTLCPSCRVSGFCRQKVKWQ
jgi:hypothetical protein